MWETTNGSFIASEIILAWIHLHEFNKSATVEQTFHACNQKIPYDIIIGRETLQLFCITLDFKDFQIIWNITSVEMKQPKFLNNRSNLLNLVSADEPTYCVQNSK